MLIYRSPVGLYVLFEVAPGQGLEWSSVWQSVVVGVEDGGVDHQGVHQPQGPEVVLQAVPYEYCAAGDEPHQVVLDVPEALDGAGLQVALGQPREAGVVVHDRVLGKHQRVVDGATVDPNLKKITYF